MELAERHLAGLRQRWGWRGKPQAPGQPRCRAPTQPQAHLLEGLPELAAGGHAQLLRDVGGHLQQQHLHEAGHDPVLQGGATQPAAGKGLAGPTTSDTARLRLALGTPPPRQAPFKATQSMAGCLAPALWGTPIPPSPLQPRPNSSAHVPLGRPLVW